jgi:hypothetical protein
LALLKNSSTMKKLFILFAFIALGFSACTNDKPEEKASLDNAQEKPLSEKEKEKELLDDVIRIHDEVMGKEEYLMRNKMKMDTFLTQGDLNETYTVEDKATISAVRFKLIKADEAMSKWMQNFDPELKGKTHEEKIKYYTEQKEAVTKIDSIFTTVIEGSNKYLKAQKH